MPVADHTSVTPIQRKSEQELHLATKIFNNKEDKGIWVPTTKSNILNLAKQQVNMFEPIGSHIDVNLLESHYKNIKKILMPMHKYNHNIEHYMFPQLFHYVVRAEG